ncbi:hypothetical protein ACFSQT_10180 [Mesorhizobium calcicola]|uniref:Uncharacterized protein n=1 Tax=Mesorhizobium calcicola TaxID=1300310 RepID=A0ABW4WAH9_9HYPH
MATNDKRQVEAKALAEVLREASVRLDNAVSQLKAAGVPIDSILKRKAALDDNNTGCNTACSCGGGGGGGGGGNCVAIQ